MPRPPPVTTATLSVSGPPGSISTLSRKTLKPRSLGVPAPIDVTEFVQALLSHGVTAKADAFYGPGIVAGVPAVRSSRKRSNACRSG
jgi:hypothetical protein